MVGLASAACALCLLAAAPVQAGTIHAFFGSFGSPGSGAGQLNIGDPQTLGGGVAVDQSTGDVYVADNGNFRVDKFDAAGNFLMAWGYDVVESGIDNVSEAKGEVQTMTVTATGGTFRIHAGGSETGPIPYNATAAEVQSALTGFAYGPYSGPPFYGGLRSGDFSVTGGPGDATGSNPYVIKFAGRLTGLGPEQLPLFEAESSLTGGSPKPSVTFAMTSTGFPGDFEVCRQGVDVCKLGTAGVRPGQLGFPAHVAVDNSGGPSKGDVYVCATSAPTGLMGVIEKFTSSGAYLSSNDGSASGATIKDCPAISIDLSGNLFTSGGSAYSQDGTFLLNLTEPGVLAVDSADNAYNNLGGEEEGRGVIKYNFFEGLNLSYEVFRAGHRREGALLAVDMATEPNTLYAIRASGVVQTYQPTTHPPLSPALEEFGQGHIATPGGIAIRGSNATAYVSDQGSDTVEIFNSVVIPDANTAAASDLSTTSATLNGAVNPLGIDAHYQFEWGTTTAYGNTAPASPADAGSGSSPVNVSEGIVGLQQGTTYHYRLSASNEHGTFHGQDETFTTLVPVTISEVFASTVASTGATVASTINPGGGPASYHVEYGTTETYGSRVPVGSEATAGSGSSGVPVTQVLEGLQPDTTYHYRFVAGNAGGPVEGEDRTFHTFGLPQAGLPDGRAYEMVSPPSKNGGDIVTRPDLMRVAVDGNAAMFTSLSSFGDAQGNSGIGSEYIAERGSVGWATHGITPNQVPMEFPQWSAGFVGDFSPDLSKAVFLAGRTLEPGHPNAQDNYNLYTASNLRTPHGASFQLLSDSVNPLNGIELHPHINLAATSADFSHVLFEDRDNLTAQADVTTPTVPKLYESVNGEPRLEGLVPPAGQTSCGPSGPACEVATSSIAGSGTSESTNDGSYTTHTISADGSRVFFEAPPFIIYSASNPNPTGFGLFGTLYMRENGETTTQLNVSERATLDPNGPQPAKLLDATPDGSRAFFVTKQELTDEVTNHHYAIYMYEVGAPEGHHLTLISRDENALDGTGDAGFVVGTSSDGSYVYFTGRNELVPGQPSFAELGLKGSVNTSPEFMYVWHEGEVRFVGGHIASSGFYNNWGNDAVQDDEGQKTVVVTPDGKHVVFTSGSPGLARLTAGYGNTSSACTRDEEDACQEIYVYSYESDHLACASCDPSGQAPLGRALVNTLADNDAAQLDSQHVNRTISDDGRYVFFSSPDPLVAGDRNSRYDVYEYNTETGKVALISTGQCGCDSYFIEATPSGHDVFFTTRQRLVGIDTDNNADLYDARVGGGIAAQNMVAPPQCQGDACQPAASAPNDPTPASAGFNGPGNPTVLGGPVKKSVGVRAHHKKRHHKSRKRRRSGKRAASHRRGGAK